ncbi:TSUP family transporter [Photobacterium minamisatsumaniensis]|uniref:TSUP family transporter n=1 Tax=Photobacterium minamisatsumaniensis TaxID=2910233 RepID=UPI003D0F2506
MFTLYAVPLSLFFAAFVRGYTGFGFSAIAILILTLSYPVAETVPAVLLLDLIISLPLVATSWNRTDFSQLQKLLWATLLGIPLGLILLWSAPNTVLQILVPSTILSLALLPSIRTPLARRMLASPYLCGLMSGWTTSAVSAGGAPVVIHLRNSKLSIQQQRDTLICYFFLTTSLTVGLGYAYRKQFYFLPEQPFIMGLLCVFGVLAGRWCYQVRQIASIHHFSYYLLLTLSGFSLLKALVALATTHH